MTLQDWREIKAIYAEPRWSREEAREMLHNWLEFAAELKREAEAEEAYRASGDVTNPLWAAAYRWRP